MSATDRQTDRQTSGKLPDSVTTRPRHRTTVARTTECHPQPDSGQRSADWRLMQNSAVQKSIIQFTDKSQYSR